MFTTIQIIVMIRSFFSKYNSNMRSFLFYLDDVLQLRSLKINLNDVHRGIKLNKTEVK